VSARRSPGSRAWRAGAAAVAWIALLASAGCSATGADGGGTITRSESLVAPGQVGLEVVRWQVADSDGSIERALKAHAIPAVASMDELALLQNGFVIVPVARDGLDAVLADMGGSYMDVRTWYGQANSWRELIASRVDDAMLEVDGIARDRRGSVARLMLRSWPLPMEDGTRIAVELVPQLVRDPTQASLLRHGDRLSGDVFTRCMAELELDRDVAWIITCDPSKALHFETPAPMDLAEVPAPEPQAAPGLQPAPEPPPQQPPPASPANPAGTSPDAAPRPVETLPTPGPVPPRPSRGVERVQPPPKVDPPKSLPSPRPVRPPLDSPPLLPPDRKPSDARSAARALAAALLAQASQEAPSGSPADPPQPPPASTIRVRSLGVQLLLAAPEGAGQPPRRTVFVLVPHLDGAPFPAAPAGGPMSQGPTSR
jgi:hypothetical protein